MFNIKPDINLAYHIWLKAERNPDMAILTFENNGAPKEVMTYGDLVGKGTIFSDLLKSNDIGTGDAFAIVSETLPEIVIALYAALTTGAVLIPLDPGFSSEKLAYLLGHSGAKGVLLLDGMEDDVEKLFSILPGLKRIERQNNRLEFFDGGNKNKDMPGEKPAGEYAMVLYTPGTTGVPKGIRITTQTLYDCLFRAEHIFQYTPQDRLYNGLPLTHSNAYFMTVLPSLCFGIPAVISRHFDTKRVWDICRDHNCTIFPVVDGLMADIYGEPESIEDATNPVRKIISTGAPRHIWKSFEQRFNVSIHEWYGTLEGAFAHNPPGIGPVGSFGKPLESHLEMKLMKEDDTECGPGETGELFFRFKGKKKCVTYQKDSGNQENQGLNGWHQTGDMVHQDSNGWMFFDYRKRDQLRRYGQSISASEVEQVILTHPDVQDVCVFGIAALSGVTGEHDLVAAIVPQSGATPRIKELFVFFSQSLPAIVVPSYIQLVEILPRTGTEKIIKRLLQENFETEKPNVYQVND